MLCVHLIPPLQTTLKALFPGAAGKKTDTRVIPQLPSESVLVIVAIRLIKVPTTNVWGYTNIVFYLSFP